MVQISKKRRLPINVKLPNATTRKAIEQLEKREGRHYKIGKSRRTLVKFFGRPPLRGVGLKIKRSRKTGRKPVKF